MPRPGRAGWPRSPRRATPRRRRDRGPGFARSSRRTPRCTSGRPRRGRRGAESSRSSGTLRSMPVATIFCLARTIRCARVCSLTRKARAICGVVRPMTARSVSGSRASGASAGWQQANSRASRSSVPGRSSGGVARAASAVLAPPAGRSRSSALRCAAVVSQAAGRCGVPSRRHAASASRTAPCTASSATSKSPKRRYSAATRRPDSSRSVAARRSSLEL